ncbi:g1632 [Coccomyxa elongata]
MGDAGTPSDPEAPRLNQSSRQEFLSLRGKDAKFEGPTEEVERILRIQKNYYAVLKVKKDTPPNEVRANYIRASRLVHPDKCSHPQAKDASAVVNQAYDTLSNSVKKTLYDRYVDDAGDLDAPDGVSYADWEAQQAVNVQVPAWMEAVLRIPGGGICLLIILLPVTLVLVVLCLILFVLCLPVRLILGLCCGIKLQPPQRERADDDTELDTDPVIINIPPDVVVDRQAHSEAASTGDTSKKTAAATSEKGQQPGGTSKDGGSYNPPPPV